jgi:mannose-6-phosphate isomerase-like protein (cupin superfamily)
MKYIRNPEDVRLEALHGFDIGPVFKRDEGEKCELIFERVAPGAKFPNNAHPDIFQFYIILRGRAIVTVGDETGEVREGSAVMIPRNTPHFMENPFDKEVEYFCVDIFPQGAAKGHETWDKHWAWVMQNL